MPSLVECWAAAITRRRYGVKFLPKQVLRRGAQQLEREYGPMTSVQTHGRAAMRSSKHECYTVDLVKGVAWSEGACRPAIWRRSGQHSLVGGAGPVQKVLDAVR
jgi:hypothetical protein